MKSIPFMVATVLGQKAMENGYPRETIVASINPNNATGVAAVDSDHVDCLRYGHELCIKRADGVKSCVAKGDALLSDNGYICTDKYSDAIYKYTMSNTALAGECPKSVEFSVPGMVQQIKFPKGKQACTVVIKDRCSAPAF